MPVLDRPHRVAPLLESVRHATPDARVIFIPDPEDGLTRSAIADVRGEERPIEGNYARKINAGIALTDEPLIFLGADDLDFHEGWFEKAKSRMGYGIGVVGTNDICNPRVIQGTHSTHSLIARWYADLGTIDEAGKLLHEGYEHEFVDDELVGTAKHRGAWAFAEDAIVEHLHPDVGKAPMDDLYAARRMRMRQGRKVFANRCPLWTAPAS